MSLGLTCGSCGWPWAHARCPFLGAVFFIHIPLAQASGRRPGKLVQSLAAGEAAEGESALSWALSCGPPRRPILRATCFPIWECKRFILCTSEGSGIELCIKSQEDCVLLHRRGQFTRAALRLLGVFKDGKTKEKGSPFCVSIWLEKVLDGQRRCSVSL